MAKFRVPFNKHRYQDLSDNAMPAFKQIEATTAEEAGLKLSTLRDNTDIEGIRTSKGNRYYIGIIHFNSIE